MKHSDFHLGCEFTTETGRWRCTDKGSRTIVAIRINPVEVTSRENGRETRQRLSQAEAEREGWFAGPPYALSEFVFDEDDLEPCEPVRER
jgi:hypothetical protein